MQLTQPQARAVMLAAQGLLHPPQNEATKADVLATIQQMHILQIDTISVVARSPYFVLWTRLGMYQQKWLEELLAEAQLFEQWVHCASFLPMSDYALYRRETLDSNLLGLHREQTRQWMTEHETQIEGVLQHIRENGPVRSADFSRQDGAKGAGWWDWKHEKRYLEWLFMRGDLMIRERVNFQRVYDLRERVIPDWDDANAIPATELEASYVEKTVIALGVTRADWIADYFRRSKVTSKKAAEELLKEGRLKTLMVQGFDDPFYYHPTREELVQQAASDHLKPDYTALLSPFDPLVWDRDRASQLFNFDYRIECYTPAAKRIYGYFTLPILHRGALVGRLDAKAHRKEKRFEVRALYLEPDVPVEDHLVQGLAERLIDCAIWHRTPNVKVTMSNPPVMKDQINDLLKSLLSEIS